MSSLFTTCWGIGIVQEWQAVCLLTIAGKPERLLERRVVSVLTWTLKHFFLECHYFKSCNNSAKTKNRPQLRPRTHRTMNLYFVGVSYTTCAFNKCFKLKSRSHHQYHSQKILGRINLSNDKRIAKRMCCTSVAVPYSCVDPQQNNGI